MNTTAQNVNDQQLELGFVPAAGRRREPARARQVARAAWWFNKMREAVNQAMDWPPRGTPQPEQTFFPGAHRQVRV